MRILCTAKDSHIFSTKNNSVFVIFMFEILTKRYLTTPLVLNNWALYAKICRDENLKISFFPAECTVMGIPSMTSNLSGFECIILDVRPLF